jgi:hypothetical protein
MEIPKRTRGRVAKQVTTDASGNFFIGTLLEGSYVLEFRAKATPDFKKQQFSIAVDGTKQSGKQCGITGNSLVRGVALNVEVARGSNVSGQVAVGASAQQNTKMVWIPPMLGSHLLGRWVEKGQRRKSCLEPEETCGQTRCDKCRITRLHRAAARRVARGRAADRTCFARPKDVGKPDPFNHRKAEPRDIALLFRARMP